MVVKRDKGTGAGLHFSEGRGDTKKGATKKESGDDRPLRTMDYFKQNYMTMYDTTNRSTFYSWPVRSVLLWHRNTLPFGTENLEICAKYICKYI